VKIVKKAHISAAQIRLSISKFTYNLKVLAPLYVVDSGGFDTPAAASNLLHHSEHN
jgi:hypothetical protein